jgi:type I restriction-modification system DNA methylase subunit
MSLFQKSVVNKYLKTLNSVEVEKSFLKFKEFYGNSVRLENIRLLKEENYQEGFLREIFVQVLGYTINPDENYNLTTEFKNLTDAKKADGAILDDGKAIGVIELKSTKTTSLESITEQAFNYKNHQPNCRYIITSNFEKIRFYLDNATDFEELNFFTMSEDDFKILYLILSKGSIFNEIPLKLKKESVLHEENISKQLYQDYSQFKRKIFENLVKNNPQFDKLSLFKKSQKLLDRFLFILFGEDSGLVPPNAVSKIIDQWKALEELDEAVPLYSRFVKFFHHLDIGHKYKTFEVPAYNGGLFCEDDILNTVQIDDEILLNDSLKLSSYDFQTEIDVNILGHIFENSLNDIEELTAELEGKAVDKKKTKRKKEGVYYTPKYITKYIVENTVGELCIQKKKKLKLDEIDISIIQNSRTKQGKLNQKAINLLDRLKSYSDYLLSLKILDPACGSGAFLNQALEFLIEEHQFVDEYRRHLEKDSLGLFDIKKSILENNIYGVDINEESVEIAKLSLWLRTAERGRKLSDLSNHIKCGNSLIDDPEIAEEKAFKWEDEFSEIMAKGGFDVIISNPPYIPTEFISKHDKIYLEKIYSSAFGRINIYPIFYEKGIQILRKEGFLSFITPYTILKNQYYKEARKVILENTSICTLVDFKGTVVFEDAAVDSIVLTLRKENIQDNKYIYISNIKSFQTHQFDIIEILQSEILRSADLSFIISIYDKFINRISKNCLPVSDVINFNQGIITGDNSKFLTAKKGKFTKKVIIGRDIHRYSLTKSNKYIIYDIEKLHRPRKKEIFEVKEKILLRQTGAYPICMIDTHGNYTLDTIHNGLIINHNFYSKYLLALLNSKLFRFLYENSINEKGKVFAQVKIIYINPLPIRVISSGDQQPFVEKVNLIINLSHSFQSLKSNFIDFLKSKFEHIKLNNKFNNWYEIDFKIFLRELEKNKVQLSLDKEAEWMQYFEEQKLKILELKTEIQQIDIEIDDMVFELYGLTKEERQIVENSFETSK